MYEKNKDDKLIKINDNEKAVSDMHDINAKESLYQKLSTREFTSKPSSNQDRPVREQINLEITHNKKPRFLVLIYIKQSLSIL